MKRHGRIMSCGQTMKKQMHMALCAGLLACFAADAAAARFGRHWTDAMVLQRDKPVTIRGSAEAGATVVVRFGGQEKRAGTDADGIWTVTLDPMPAEAGGRDLTCRVADAAAEPVVLRDVVVGDVFLVARQTTVDLSLRRDDAGRAAAAAHRRDPRFRALAIRTIPAAEPLDDLADGATAGWAVVDSSTALGLSGAAYHLGQELVGAVEVPVGIVDVNLGPRFPIGWLSREALLETSAFLDQDIPENINVESYALGQEEQRRQFLSGEIQAALDARREEAIVQATRFRQPEPARILAEDPVEGPLYPAAGYNAVLHPLRGLALKGLLLQLGNDYPYLAYQRMMRDGTILDRAKLGQAWKDTNETRKLCIYLEPVTTPRLVPHWRQTLGDAALPVGLITPPGSELATLAVHHREMRELQRRVSEANDGVGLILPGMEAIPFSAQPADEARLADRSLQWILGEVYGRDVVPVGPRFDRLETRYATAQIVFKPGTAEGLTALPGGLDLFEAAGADGVFSPARAQIEGDTVRIESETVNRIVHVRYNWRENPAPGLVNRAGLPAPAFRTDAHDYPRTIGHTEDDLPREYVTPASEWEEGDVAIISGSLAARNWPNGDGWLGATGLRVGPFGPNMSVLQVLPGSPAAGNILTGDMIYEVNGTLLGEDPLRTVSHALTHAESEAGGGVIRFGRRRAGRNRTVALQLEVLGTYSPTAPYDCPKTDRIVANLEAFLAERGGDLPNSGGPGGFLGTDTLFLLAAGTPEYQGLVRRVVYARMAAVDIERPIDPMQPRHPQSWHLGASALLTAEYYLATGDRNVLPHLKWWCDYLARTQVKEESATIAGPPALPGQAGGWRHNWHGGQTYGLLPAIGLPAMLGLHLAREAGVEIDQRAYERGMELLRHNGAEAGSVFYGWKPEPTTRPRPISPADLRDGMLSSNNGAISMAAILFDMAGDERTAHLCSLISAHAFNNTHNAHGGNFWSNCWTPLGANVHSRDAFIHFMQGHRWYRELNRLHNHSYYQGDTAKIGAGQMLALVVPRQRLRILGAPESVFGADPEEVVQPALEAYARRDYAGTVQLADALLASGTLPATERRQAQQLRQAALDVQASIASDLDKVEALVAAGKLHEAALDLPQLEGVVAPGNPRLEAIQRALAAPAAGPAISADKPRYEARQRELRFSAEPPAPAADEEQRWRPLLTEIALRGDTRAPDKAAPGEATVWRLRIIEGMPQAPDGWFEPGFDDRDWLATELPISWHLNHTALARATFEIEDKNAFDALRLRLWVFRQQNIEIYLNGAPVARINQASNNQWLQSPLTGGALRALRNGTNTIAVTTRNNWRWGSYFRHYETAFDSSVLNGGLSVLLDGRTPAGTR